jgi:transcriptional regulator with XRE-family HTH domain
MTTPLARFLDRQLALRQESADEFAARAEMGRSHVYHILTGRLKHPRSDTMARLAAGLGMTTGELYAAVEGTAATAAGINEDEAELLAIYRLVPEDQRPTAIRLVEALRPTTSDTTPHGTSGNRAQRTRTGSTRRGQPPTQMPGTNVVHPPALAGTRRAA